jgi:hypothetical protein
MEEPLADSVQDLEDQLKLLGHAKMTCYSYLKRQFSAREARAGIDKFTYPEIGVGYRDKAGKKLKMTPSHGEEKHEHLKKTGSINDEGRLTTSTNAGRSTSAFGASSA